jgi:hypothetical protein
VNLNPDRNAVHSHRQTAAEIPLWVVIAAQQGPDYELAQIHATLSRDYLSNEERHTLEIIATTLKSDLRETPAMSCICPMAATPLIP